MAKKKFNWYDLSMAERAKLADKVGADVATIMNKAKAQAEKLLKNVGYGCNVQVDFFDLRDLEKEQQKQEVKK